MLALYVARGAAHVWLGGEPACTVHSAIQICMDIGAFQRLASLLQEVTIRKGQTLGLYGEEGCSIYLLAHGHVDVVTVPPREILLQASTDAGSTVKETDEELSAPDMFGEAGSKSWLASHAAFGPAGQCQDAVSLQVGSVTGC